MRPRLNVVRIGLIVFAAASLNSCSPAEVEIVACEWGGKLAFWIEDTDGWIFDSVPRPYSVEVYEPFVGPMWETQVPHRFIGSALHTHQPQRRIIRYGQRFEGWETRTNARSLGTGLTYHVEIWTDGGRGMLSLTPGTPLPDCDGVRPSA